MIEALPDLGALAAALFLLLIAAALWVLTQLLVNTLGKAPLIGSWVSGTLAGWLNDARNAILGAAKDSWHAAVQLFNWMGELQVKEMTVAWHFMDSASGAISRLAYVRLPALLFQATNYALGLYHAATSYAQALQAQVLVWADGQVARLENLITSAVATALVRAEQLVTAARAEAAALVARAEADAANAITRASTALQAEISADVATLEGDIRQVDAWAVSAVGQLGRDLTSGLASAEALAFSQLQALQRGIYTDLETAGEAALQVAWPDAIPDIEALRQALGADFPDIRALLDALAGAGAAGLLHALISSLAGTQAITKLATECIVPNCRNLGGLGNFLNQLFADATDLALIAWLAEGVRNPGGWAGETDALLGSIATDTASAARTLLGV